MNLEPILYTKTLTTLVMKCICIYKGDLLKPPKSQRKIIFLLALLIKQALFVIVIYIFQYNLDFGLIHNRMKDICELKDKTKHCKSKHSENRGGK